MPTSVGIQEIVKRFGSAAPAVAGVSIDVKPGELFFLLGPSGCGKTTLLRMIAGFTEPTAGRITFGTPAGVRDVTHAPPNARNTGMVFQSYALWPHMTVAANVAFGLEVRRVPRAQRDARVREALALVQMESYADRRPNQLSGGQQQRVALARAIVVRPDVLLLDEPLSNLDAKLRGELRSEIRRICTASGITTVYVTHDQKEALSMADRIAIMRGGSVEQLGAPEDLYRRPRSAFVAEFLGETNFIPGIVEAADARGVEVRTGIGRLRSAFAPPEGCAAAGSPVLASLRPEAIRLSEPAARAGDNVFHGSVADATYLGESAHLLVKPEPMPGALGGQTDAGGVPTLRVAVMNPRGIARGRVALAVDPEDVVLVPPNRLDRGT
ncbi:MAG: ABC transporter ATP-binding protein [Phycisphaerae bacterium]|nr:ABC transporter ATP-binding protein [Phycisphaerae bacterium]